MTDTTVTESPTPEATQPETTQADPQQVDKPKGPSKADLAKQTESLIAQVSTLTAQVTTLVAAKSEADKAVEESRRNALSEADKVAEDRKALDAERAQVKAEARLAAAEKLGILPKALALAPDADPRTPEGAKALSDWAQQNPEFVQQRQAPGTSYSPPPESALAQVLAGVKNSPYISTDGIRKMLGRR